MIVGQVLSSDGITRYDIERLDSDALICSCIGFRRRAKCRHIKEMEERLMNPKLKFKLTFKQGPHVVAEVVGLERSMDALTAGDVTERILETEAYLERLTGLRLYIETAEE